MFSNKFNRFTVISRGWFGFVTLLLLTLFVVLVPFKATAQGKQANIWYFGGYAGITFNQGSPPVALLDSQMNIVGVHSLAVPVLPTATANCSFIPMALPFGIKTKCLCKTG